MKKVIVTLQGGATASVEVPEAFPRRRRAKGKARAIARSVFGAIRFFPGVPKAISGDELEYIRAHRGDVSGRLEVRPYVESKRVDYRGASEAEIERLADEGGIAHLGLSAKVERLAERGKLEKPDRRKSTETKLAGKAPKVGEGGSKRKPK
jgi:hypothetical protein